MPQPPPDESTVPSTGPSTGPSAASPRVLGNSVLQSQTLESLASARRYHAWLTGLALPYLGEHPVELGSGLGDYAERWLDDGVARITVTERDESRLAVLSERFAADPRVQVLDLDVLQPPSGNWTSFVALNVLEHIPDHIAALRAAHRLLVPGGSVVMFVPAFAFAMSAFDRQVGHVRRYTRRTLAAAYEDAGLRIERLHYVNAPGLLAWLVGMRLLRMTPGDGPLLQAWDRAVIPVAQALERRVRPPFGQSVFAVGRVPG